MTVARSRRGFTLVELLVVAALLATVFGLVLNGIGRPNLASTVRRTAQDFASRLLAVQSQALGKPEGAALILVPDAANARLGTTVLDAVTHPFITGSASGIPPVDPRVTSAAVTVVADTEFLSNAYKVRFQSNALGNQLSPGTSPWFTCGFGVSSTSGTVAFRGSDGQTLANTIWPRSSSQANQAVLARLPTAGAAGREMARQIAIDLRHSGMGEDPAASHGYGRFEATGSIAIAFEQSGRVGEVMRRVQEARTAADQPLDATGVIYFLFVPRDDIVAGRNTLANPQTVWVAINSQTGRVTVAENVPQSAEDATALAAARVNARLGAAMR